MGAMTTESAVSPASAAAMLEPGGKSLGRPGLQDPAAAAPGDPDRGVGAPPASTEVFVGGLPSDATDEAVASAFAKVGTVLAVR